MKTGFLYDYFDVPLLGCQPPNKLPLPSAAPFCYTSFRTTHSKQEPTHLI